jgi:hypothetical protein
MTRTATNHFYRPHRSLEVSEVAGAQPNPKTTTVPQPDGLIFSGNDQ